MSTVQRLICSNLASSSNVEQRLWVWNLFTKRKEKEVLKSQTLFEHSPDYPSCSLEDTKQSLLFQIWSCSKSQWGITPFLVVLKKIPSSFFIAWRLWVRGDLSKLQIMELQELSSRNLERFSSFGVPLVMPQKHVIGSAVVGQISCSSSSSTSSAASNATTNTTNSARLVEQKIRKTGRSQGSSANKPVFRARNRSEDSILSPKGKAYWQTHHLLAVIKGTIENYAC